MRTIPIVVVSVVAAACAAAPADDAALERARADVAAVHGQVYEALERAPIRGWADQSTPRPLFDLQSRLRHPPKEADRLERLLRSVPSRLAEIHQGFVETLRLKPAATIRLDESGRVRLEQGKSASAIAYVDVPSAIVFRVAPPPVAASLAAAPIRAAGVAADGQELKLRPRHTQYLVLPLTAAGEPGRRDVRLKLTAGGTAADLPITLDVRAGGVLRGNVAGGDGRALAAKLFVEDAAGRLYVVPGERNYRTQSWYAPWQPRYSYVGERFTMPLPPGRYRITAMKGCGWADWTGDVEIEPGRTADCRIEMRPLCPLEQAGWFCGDMHVHHRGGPTLRQLRAEDVNVAANTLYASRKAVALPAYPKQSDPTHLSTSNQEIEHWVFGNVFYYNIPRTVIDPPAGKAELTPMFHYDEQAHRMGGISLRWLRGRPFGVGASGQQQPELAVNAALGHMDVWSVLENSMQNLLDDPRRRWAGDGWGGRLYEHTYRTWYALMNCGLRIPIAAGTSYGRLSRIGFNRVYAKVEGQLTNASWAAALKRGDGFVTNGPLLRLRAGAAGRPADRLAGDGIALDRPGKVRLDAELISRHPVRRMEILQNGKVIVGLGVERPGEPVRWTGTVDVKQPCWLAARCFGEHKPRYPHCAAHNQFAHTNALFVTVGGRRPTSPSDAGRFVKEIDALVAYAPKLPTDRMRQRAMTAYRKAREYFARQAQPRSRP